MVVPTAPSYGRVFDPSAVHGLVVRPTRHRQGRRAANEPGVASRPETMRRSVNRGELAAHRLHWPVGRPTSARAAQRWVAVEAGVLERMRQLSCDTAESGITLLVHSLAAT